LGSLGRGAPSVVLARRGDPSRGGRSSRREFLWEEIFRGSEVGRDAILYRCSAAVEGEEVASFAFAITVSGDAVTVETRDIVERGPFDIEVFRFPEDPWIRVSSELPGARAAFANLNGPPGRVVRPGQEVEAEWEFAVLWTETAAAGFFANVLSRPVRARSGPEGIGLWPADHRYSYKEENAEPFCCRIAIVGDVQGDGAIDWEDAAARIHDSIPRRVELRLDSVKYMANHGLDFERFVSSTRQICNLADGQTQICLLSGWNGWGWDSEYPSADFPGEEYGGREGLYRLHEGARAHRAYVTMVHNFDDAYADSRAFDPAVVCRRPDGSLWEATWWAGGPSYIVCPYKFWRTGAMRRTIDTLIAQGLERQIFSDVFTIIPYRESHDPDDPTDSATNLVLGKFKVLDYLRSHDIYMNSEGFNYEMLGRYIEGHNGFPLGLSRDPDRPPLALFIVHGLLTKKFWRHTDEGRFVGGDTEVENPWVVDDLYRWALLIPFYGEKPMRDFQVIPEGFRARYGEDVIVTWRKEVAPEGQAVAVEVGGRLISDGPSVLLPKPGRPGVHRAYTSTGEAMRYPRPPEWSRLDDLTLLRLSAEEPPRPVPLEGRIRLEGDVAVLDLPKGVPHKIVAGKDRLAAELAVEPLPPKALAYPLDEVLERSAPERPRWVRKVSRKALERELGWDSEAKRFCVGCSAVWPTLEAAKEHAANIIARKVAWFVRQKYVSRTRSAEAAAGATTEKLRYDNWQLGYTTARRLYARAAVERREGTETYWEKVHHGPERELGYKAFTATPIAAEELHEVYIQAARDRLEECRSQFERASGSERAALEANIRVYERILADEPSRAPAKLAFDMF
ncbi:MAG: endo-alpha-N-acetylgalactosaminidase family protein, partial [Planctomycetota bacterium]